MLREEAAHEDFGPAPGQVPELDTRAGLCGGGLPAREVRKEGRYADPLKAEGWLFPASFVRVVKRLQVLRSSRPTRVRAISDNPNHPSEEAPLGEVEIVGKVLCCLKLF